MTRFVARQLATEHFFNLDGLKRDLDFEPQISNEEGFERLKKALHND